DPVAGAVTDTSVTVSADSITVRAVTLTNGFSSGSLSFASARSESVTTYRSGGKAPVTKTNLVVDGGRAGGQSFTFGPEGLKVANAGVPLPAGQSLAALNQALAPSGLSMKFEDPTPTAGGAI